ncbi:MAG: hypothetical protein RSD40_04160 [Bacilli bacterium]
MNCEIINELNELEKIEIIRLSERIEALKELKDSDLTVYVNKEDIEGLIQQINKKKEETNLLIEKWWREKYSKYTGNNICTGDLSNCCN